MSSYILTFGVYLDSGNTKRSDIVVIGVISPPVRFAQAFGKAVNKRLGGLVEGLRILSAFDVAHRSLGFCRSNELFYLMR
jgi:hypothetical protein